ncbi:fibrocystin-like protein, partial [Brachionus plicatilis]
MEDPIETISLQDQDKLIKTELNNFTASIINGFTTGILQDKAMQLFNVTLSDLLVQKPNSNGTDAPIKKINRIVVQQEADRCKEMVPCEVQPVLKVVDENKFSSKSQKNNEYFIIFLNQNKVVQVYRNAANDDLLLNMANEEFPWIVEAEIYDSDSPSAQIVVQTEASLEDDGYVRFENMSISEITSSFKILYKFKTPQGLTDSNYTPPSLASTKSLSSTKAEFSCISDQSNMVVVENEFFDLSVSVIDKFSSKQVKNLDWKNHTWQATIGIHKMEKCQAEGSLQVDSLNTSAYLADGVFNFENLYINKTG